MDKFSDLVNARVKDSHRKVQELGDASASDSEKLDTDLAYKNAFKRKHVYYKQQQVKIAKILKRALEKLKATQFTLEDSNENIKELKIREAALKSQLDQAHEESKKMRCFYQKTAQLAQSNLSHLEMARILQALVEEHNFHFTSE